MPKISLKKAKVDLQNGNSGDITTLELINKALDGAPAEGLSVADFRARAKVDITLNKLAPDAEELILNDADFATVQKSFESVRFISRHDVIKTLMAELNPEVEEAYPTPMPERELHAV
jgi:hypothetical protein